MTDSEPKTKSKATRLGAHIPKLEALDGIIILSGGSALAATHHPDIFQHPGDRDRGKGNAT